MPPAFEAVREKVLGEWRRLKAEEISELSFARLEARYRVVRPGERAP